MARHSVEVAEGVTLDWSDVADGNNQIQYALSVDFERLTSCDILIGGQRFTLTRSRATADLVTEAQNLKCDAKRGRDGTAIPVYRCVSVWSRV